MHFSMQEMIFFLSIIVAIFRNSPSFYKVIDFASIFSSVL